MKGITEVFIEKTDSLNCVKCNKEERSVIFKPCRHFQYCGSCAS